MNNNSFEDVRYVAFNQDCTSLAVGTNKGCKLFSLLTLDSLDLIYTFDKDDVYIIERLFSSSLVVLVNSTSPRKLKVFHFKKGTEICSYNYANTILSVKLNRARLIVCLEEALFIHNIKDMKVLHTIRDTPSNQHGVIALTTNYISPPNLLPTYSSDTYQCSNNNPNNISYLAYPGSNSFGEVQIFDTINLRAVTMIPAHENPVAALAFNSNGTKIATASEKGTVIRVFSTLDGTKLHEFRRGMKRCVTVFSLHFSPDSIFLALSSNTETVHVFKLEMEDGQRCDGNILGLQRTSNSSLDHHHHPSNKTNANYYYQQNPSHSNTAGGSSIKSVATTASSVFTSIVGSNTTSALYDYFNKALTTTSNYLPGQMGDILTQNRSFATAYLPPNPLAQPGQPSIVTSLGISTPLSSKNICAIISPLSITDSPYYQGKSVVPTEHNVSEKCFDKYYLVVASYTGTLYMYEFDKDIGGDCSFVKSFRFTSSPKLKGGTTDLIMSNEDYAEQRQQTINVPISEDAQIVLTPISATPSSSPYNNSKTPSTQGGGGGCYQTTTAVTNLSAKLKNPEKIILKTAAPAAISIADDFSNGGLINEYSSNNLTTTFPLPVISSAPSPTTFLENNDQNYPPAIFSYATALNKKQ